MQATGTILPNEAANVINKGAWGWVRTKEKNAFDNGILSSHADAGTPDGPNPANSDLDPTTTGGKIFNLDAPGAPNVGGGINVNHTTELYENFIQYATIDLNGVTRCSDQKTLCCKQ